MSKIILSSEDEIKVLYCCRISEILTHTAYMCWRCPRAKKASAFEAAKISQTQKLTCKGNVMNHSKARVIVDLCNLAGTWILHIKHYAHKIMGRSATGGRCQDNSRVAPLQTPILAVTTVK